MQERVGKDVGRTVLWKQNRTPPERQVEDKQEHMKVQRFKLYSFWNEYFPGRD